MFRYKLRTLLIVLALGPALIAGGWWGWGEWQEHRRIRQIIEQERQSMHRWRYFRPEAYYPDGTLKLPPPDENRSPVPAD